MLYPNIQHKVTNPYTEKAFLNALSLAYVFSLLGSFVSDLLLWIGSDVLDSFGSEVGVGATTPSPEYFALIN